MSESAKVAFLPMPKEPPELTSSLTLIPSVFASVWNGLPSTQGPRTPFVLKSAILRICNSSAFSALTALRKNPVSFSLEAASDFFRHRSAASRYSSIDGNASPGREMTSNRKTTGFVASARASRLFWPVSRATAAKGFSRNVSIPASRQKCQSHLTHACPYF